jgi:hypothetical protein
MRKNLLTTVIILSFLCSCGRVRELRTLRKANDKRSYMIKFLFEHEGCKIYRFYDWGWVYFSNCNGETISKIDSIETRTLNRKNQ